MGLKAHAAEFVPGGGGGGGGGHKQLSKSGPKANHPNSNGGQSKKRSGGGGKLSSSSRNSSVVGAANNNSSNIDQPQAGSDLTAHAQEFVPGSGGRGDNDGGDSSGGATGAAGGGRGSGGAVVQEKMVQVVRGGTIYFVPESEALATDELVAGTDAYGVEHSVEEGFQWAHESTGVPAPQRRTMHR